ncbi:DUF2272 domain-containing protein [Dongia sp.]|uniref:DUF2272 domain-containing protein n=1 Tax=Dongia sp. TaxID=1977262 RepID=UPI0035AE6483
MTAFVDRLIGVARAEWERFGRQEANLHPPSPRGIKESDERVFQRVGDYWRFIGGDYAHLTGKSTSQPWSAAFISFCMHEAGAGEMGPHAMFPYSPGHSVYINRAISNKAKGLMDAPIVGHKLGDYAPKVGDLIGYWRGDVAVTYDTARAIGWYPAHTDIVVAVDVPNRHAYSIGGNVGDSVTKREVALDADGLLIDTKQKWFVAIENNM